MRPPKICFCRRGEKRLHYRRYRQFAFFFDEHFELYHVYRYTNAISNIHRRILLARVDLNLYKDDHFRISIYQKKTISNINRRVHNLFMRMNSG